jgi:toxin ParE1/3/4
MARIVERPRARQELEDIAVIIGRDRPAAARRFLAAAQKLYGLLAAIPEFGARWKAEDARFADLRHFAIPKFSNYVVFYRPLPDGVEIVHVLHGARDLGPLLGDEESPD